MSAKLPELWLKYADDDLAGAEILLNEKIYNIVCFHCQQAVEKLLKSIIAAYGQEIPRIHNLIRLTSICEELHGDSFALDDEALIFLNDVYIVVILLISVFFHLANRGGMRLKKHYPMPNRLGKGFGLWSLTFYVLVLISHKIARDSNCTGQIKTDTL